MTVGGSEVDYMHNKQASHQAFISYSSKDKAVADAACHFLEDAGIRCWIAPRDIVSGADWAESIALAIRQADVFIVIVSKNSIASQEVAKEITLATRRCPYILPFRIDSEELTERFDYHLSCYHWLDALTPPIENQLIRLVDRVKSIYEPADGGRISEAEHPARLKLPEDNKRLQVLQPKPANPRRTFVGREDILEAIDTEFAAGNRVVFLCGMGGIGKSEIAKAYITQSRDKYDTCVFANYTSDLLALFSNDGEIAINNVTQGMDESSEAYFERKLAILRETANDRTVIVIDNFDVPEDEYMERVLTIPCRFLITTRTDFESTGSSVIRVREIEDMEKLKEIFFAYYRNPLGNEEEVCVEEIIRQVSSHTITVEMIASQMKASRVKPDKMLKTLRSAGLQSGLKEGFRHGISDRKATAYDYIKALYNVSALTPGETEILRHLSILSQTGMETELFAELLNLDGYDTVNSLAERSWLRIDDENDHISLHPVVAEVMRRELLPDQKNCLDFLKALRDTLGDGWNKAYAETRRFEEPIYAVLRAFTEPIPDTLELMEYFSTFCWLQFNFQLAESSALRLFEMCEREFGLYSVKTGWMALRVAAVYYNQNDYDRADPWYEKGLEYLLGSAGETHEETALAFHKVGRAYHKRGDFERAEENFARMYAIYKRLISLSRDDAERKELRKLQNAAKREHALLCLEKKDYAAAYDMITNTIEMQDGGVDFNGSTNELYARELCLGVVNGIRGHREEAENHLRTALDIVIEYRGEQGRDALATREYLADEYLRQERYFEAAEQLGLALTTLLEFYGHKEADMERLERKLEECRKTK